MKQLISILISILTMTVMSAHSQDNKFSLESISPNLAVKDVNKTVEYYQTHFGFKQVASNPEAGVWEWAMVEHNGKALMFQSEQSLAKDLSAYIIKAGNMAGTLFIKMQGVKELYKQVSDKVKIVSDLKDTFYGMREFTIEDLNGYILTFAEEIK